MGKVPGKTHRNLHIHHEKKWILNGLIIMAAGLCLTACRSNRHTFRTIEARQAAPMASRQNIIILDVRTPQEFAAGHLPGAINIDYLNPTFSDSIRQLEKNKKYLVYCKSGNRSTKAADIMQQLGFRKVTNMLGGITRWQGQIIK